MKKLAICIFLATLICVTFVCNCGIVAQASTIEQECDTVFFEVLNAVLLDKGIATSTNTISKTPLYDLNLQQMGYLYNMVFESTQGYAIVVNLNGIFDVVELYLDATNPYSAHNGQAIYVTAFTYLVFENSQYVEPTTGLVLDQSDVQTLRSNALYCTNYVFTQSEETVYYTNRVVNEYKVALNYPTYIPVDTTNGCAPAAGGNILGYYARYFPELIPGFTAGTAVSGTYYYRQMNEQIATLIQSLLVYMETNVGGPGTTIQGFKNGLTTYCNEKGRNVSFYTCMQSNQFSFPLAKQYLSYGKPILVFVDTFTIATMGDNDTHENIHYFVANACHTMVGFGYREVTYTLSNGQTRTDKYLDVSTGLSLQESGFFNINYNTHLDDVYAVNIY